MRLIANQLQSGFDENVEDADFWINYQGYQGGTTRYRDFRIGDGKQGQIAFFDGSSGNTTFAGQISGVKELVNIKSANGLRSAGLESDSTGNIWLGTGTTAATINFVTGNSTNGLPSTNGVKRLTTNREGTDVYASYASNTFPFRVGFLNGSTYTPTFVVNDNGNVGIGTGTNSPIGRLDILGVAGSVGSLGQLNRAGINLRIPNVIGQYTQIAFSNDGGGAFGYGAIGMVMTNGSGIGLADMIFSTKGLGTDVVSTERMRITSAGAVSIGTTNNAAKLNVGGSILASDDNQSSGMYVRRTLNLAHPGNTGTFTRTFNPVTQFGISRLGGNVLLEVSGWSQRVNCGYIQWQNAGGSGNITTVNYVQTASLGSGGDISVSVNSANDNSIDINFSNWHSNSHAWLAKIVTQ